MPLNITHAVGLASLPHLLSANLARASGASWTRSRSFARTIHERVDALRADGVRDADLLTHLQSFLPGIANWHAYVRRYLATREGASPAPYIWEITHCEFPGFADVFHLWAVECAIAGPLGPRAPDAAGPIVFSSVEDAALPGAVQLAVAEVLRHRPDPDSSLPAWEKRATHAQIAALRRLTPQTASTAAAHDRSALLDCLVCAEQEALRRAESAEGVNRSQERRFRRLSTRYLTMRYRITGGPTALERAAEAMARHL